MSTLSIRGWHCSISARPRASLSAIASGSASSASPNCQEAPAPPSEDACRHTTNCSSGAKCYISLEYDFYKDTCPQAETVARFKINRIYSQHRILSAQLPGLFFHGYFV